MADAMSRWLVSSRRKDRSRVGDGATQCLRQTWSTVRNALFTAVQFEMKAGSFQLGRHAARPPLDLPINDRAGRWPVSPGSPAYPAPGVTVSGPALDGVRRRPGFRPLPPTLSIAIYRLLFTFFVFLIGLQSAT